MNIARIKKRYRGNLFLAFATKALRSKVIPTEDTIRYLSCVAVITEGFLSQKIKYPKPIIESITIDLKKELLFFKFEYPALNNRKMNPKIKIAGVTTNNNVLIMLKDSHDLNTNLLGKTICPS